MNINVFVCLDGPAVLKPRDGGGRVGHPAQLALQPDQDKKQCVFFGKENFPNDRVSVLLENSVVFLMLFILKQF